MTGGCTVRPGRSPADRGRCAVTPERAGWAYCGLRVLELPAGRRASFDTGADEMLVLPLAGVVHGDLRRRGGSSWPAGRASSSGPPTSPTCRAARAVTVSSADGGRFALPSARAARRLPFRLRRRPATCRWSCAAPGACSRQVNNFCTPEAFDGRPADRRARCSPRRQLVVLPAAQARRGPAGRERSWRRSTTSRSAAPAGPGRLPAGLRHRGRPIDVLRRGAHRRRGADPARLARPVDGRARLRPLLPERDGRPGAERAWLICDDPAHAWVRDTWARPGDRPAAAADRHRGRQRERRAG